MLKAHFDCLRMSKKSSRSDWFDWNGIYLFVMQSKSTAINLSYWFSFFFFHSQMTFVGWQQHKFNRNIIIGYLARPAKKNKRVELPAIQSSYLHSFFFLMCNIFSLFPDQPTNTQYMRRQLTFPVCNHPNGTVVFIQICDSFHRLWVTT